MAWNRTDELKRSIRSTKEASAKFQEIADKGGDQNTSAARATLNAHHYQRMAEKYARELEDQ
jgi:hypothetical protein